MSSTFMVENWTVPWFKLNFQDDKLYHTGRNDMPTSNQHRESAFPEL